MAIIKCKMCGGDIVLNEEKTFGTCEYCGSTMTLPKVSDEQRAARFNRGNHFRRQGEFDKALAVYETIVREDDTDAEAHWCCALCRFGIEYVEDPNTFEYLPTCHRASFDSFLEDVDYQAAIEYSEGITKRQYQKDAAKIAEVQRGILAASQNEEPFDVFICYKETDDTTKERTRDSIDAQEIYYQLTQEGYRVFFSRITLEEKAGTEYEPYIFAALNSAKVMVAIGSKPEYFNAVWVKNEWSRFLAMMRKDRSKLLLPCYKGMDPYDLPEKLGVLQSYDMTKIGFMQELKHGIKKVLPKGEEKYGAQPTPQQVIVREVSGGPNLSALLDRGTMALEDSQWDKAAEYYDQVLNQDAKNSGAFLGLALANAKSPNLDAFIHQISNRFTNEPSQTFPACDPDTKRIDAVAKKLAVPGYLTEEGIKAPFEYSLTFPSREAAARKNKESTLEALRSDRNFTRAIQYADPDLKAKIEAAEKKITAACDRRIETAKMDAAAAKADVLKRYQAHLAEQEHAAEKRKQQALRKKRNVHLAVLAAVFAIAAFFVVTKGIIPNNKYSAAVKLYEDGKYEDAITAFQALGGYRDSESQLEKCYIGKYGEEKYNLIKLIEHIKVGDTYTFGAYEQDNNTANGKEEIEWIVLEKDGMSLLLISKYALDCQQYNTSRSSVTWETCSLRKWLNGTFLNTAFSESERSMIPYAKVSADKNPDYGTSPGNSTTDQVFLMSFAEGEKYLSYEARECTPTAYAIAQGAKTHNLIMANGNVGPTVCEWWLRSPGYDSSEAAICTEHGLFFTVGHYVDYIDRAVRPSLWINFGS